MKKLYFIALISILFVYSYSLSQNVVSDTLTFNGYPLDPMTGYFNGSTLPTGSTSFPVGNYTLDNNYNSGWDSWSGFAVSKIKDSTTPGWTNQYAAYPFGGVDDSEEYGVAYLVGEHKIEFDTERTLKSINITNTTYAVLSMRNGDGFGKVFGSPNNAAGDPDGTDGKDWFLLEIMPLDNDDKLVGDTIKFYLADFRFDDNSKDYIVTEWNNINLGNVTAKKLSFKLSSSDVGLFGLNTPAYFAFDNLITQKCYPINETVNNTVCENELPITWNNQNITEAGTYTHTETLTNGCDSTTTLNLTVTPTAGINKIDNLSVKIYPNPTSENINVIVEEESILKLINASGKIILIQTINGNSNIELSDVPSGLYIVLVTNQNGIYKDKISKQ